MNIENNETINDVVNELKENTSFTSIINKTYKKPVREVTVYLDMDAALEAADLSMELSTTSSEIAYQRENGDLSISQDEISDLLELEKTITERLVKLNERIQQSKLVWEVKALTTEEWSDIDLRARKLYPVDDVEELTENEKNEILIKRNEYVNIEQIRLGTESITSADGTKLSDISHDDAKHFWHNVASEPVLAIKEKIEELTYGTAQFDKLLENQDFLS